MGTLQVAHFIARSTARNAALDFVVLPHFGQVASPLLACSFATAM
jgi:hypothetical protein